MGKPYGPKVGYITISFVKVHIKYLIHDGRWEGEFGKSFPLRGVGG